jgi:flagellar motor switch protein FliG
MMSDDIDTVHEHTAAPKAKKIDGASASAILLMLLDESEAATLLKHFDPSEIRLLGKAMFAASDASEAEIERALDQFVLGSRTVSTFAIGAEPRIRRVMNEALGNVRADNILAAIAPQSSANALDILRWMEVPVIAHIVAHEHPQVSAILLSVLTPEIAAQVLEDMPDQDQADLVLRAARLTQVSADAIADIEQILTRAAEPEDRRPTMKLGGKTDVAKIVNNMKRPSSERMMKSLKKKDKQLGEDIEEEMFIFDNLLELDSKSLGEVMRSIDGSILGLALKGASDAIIDKMLSSMSARAAQTIRDDMTERGLVKRTEVEEAQRAIIAVARKLAAEGTIMLCAQGDDYV